MHHFLIALWKEKTEEEMENTVEVASLDMAMMK